MKRIIMMLSITIFIVLQFNIDVYAFFNRECEIDISTAEKGYITAIYHNPNSSGYLWIEYLSTGVSCRYGLPGNGEKRMLSLSFGDGLYRVIITDYTDNILESEQFEVTFDDPKKPFLESTFPAEWKRAPLTINKADELYAQVEESQFILNVIQYVHENIEYDFSRHKATKEINNSEMQLARREGINFNKQVAMISYHPDETFLLESGICGDKAILAAAMLRSKGIPTKIMVGKYENGQVQGYHVWLSIYTAETDWQLYDPTLGATYANHDFSTHIPMFCI